MEVYIDLYFLINASMDFLCLLITARLLHRRAKMLRLVFGAVMGGGYAVLSLLLGLGGVLGPMLDVAMAILLAATVFFTNGTRFWRILQAALTYVLVSMILGGIMTALYTWLNRLNLPFEVVEGDTLSVWVLGILALVAGIATSRGGGMLGLSQKTKAVEIDAILLGRRVRLRAMVDTGNLLCDPVSGRRVIVADRKRLGGVLPRELVGGGKGAQDALFAWLKRSPTHAARIRLIPAQTAGGHTLLPAILPEQLTLREGKECYEADYLIAISDLGSTAQDFDAVIPSA